jgi:hypothetical protein
MLVEDAPKITISSFLFFYENNDIYLLLEKQLNADKPWCFKLGKYSSET